jgi:hypothetical protein
VQFDVTFRNVADQDLGALLAQGAVLGYVGRSVDAVPATAERRATASGRVPAESGSRLPREPGSRITDEFLVSAAAGTADELVPEWLLEDRRQDQTYQWPDFLERYDSYDLYLGPTSNGPVYIALGWTRRAGAWGRDRDCVVSFLSRGAPQTPLAEFLETDDYADTGELLAVIRGSDGARRMYRPGDALPPPYAGQFRTEVYRDRVDAKGAWNRMAVVARRDHTGIILNHALIQARRRGEV